MSPGRLTDVVLLVMVAEGVLLARAGRGWRAAATALLPGALLVLALRFALDGAAWPLVAAPLTLSLPAHLLDLRARGWLGPAAIRAPRPRSRSPAASRASARR